MWSFSHVGALGDVVHSIAVTTASTGKAGPAKPVPNNFTLLRVVLALLVVLGHFKVLPGIAPAHGIFGYADFAVDAFFVVSGYLVTGSFDKQPHVSGFYVRRFFRVYPLYLVVVMVQAVVMVQLLPGGLAQHVGGFIKYLAANSVFATFLGYDVDGLLNGLKHPGINPSLWTLKIEVGFYLLLPLLWRLTQRYGVAFLVAVFLASTVYVEYALHAGAENMAKQLPAQLRFFAVGIGLYRYRHAITLPVPAAVASSVLLFGLCTLRHDLPMVPVYPLFVGLLVFIVALRLPAFVLPFDISYGVYLVHGPLIQLSLLLGIYRDTSAFLFALVGYTVLLALAADFCIERPGIALGHRLAPRKRGPEQAGGKPHDA
jgi:peptidoglycan/LPS O-acetylase OafA/YrhL